MMKKLLIISFLLLMSLGVRSQASYIVEQLGRNQHQIVQSLGAFLGNDNTESQAFDITFMPSGNGVEGVMIINTADFRCTFKMDARKGECFEIILDIRYATFQQDFNRLFQTYKTESFQGYRLMNFGNYIIKVADMETHTGRFNTYRITIQS